MCGFKKCSPEDSQFTGQGTNFVGAQNELRVASSEMDQDHVQEYLLRNGCDVDPFQDELAPL